MESNLENLDPPTVRDFGREWQRFDQSAMLEGEIARMFDGYFSIFPRQTLPGGAVGFDAGCGSGRWAALVAPRVGGLHCIDASIDALGVAKTRLTALTNVSFHEASLDTMPLSDDSMDFGYCLGVLHHLPDPAAGRAACVRKLKRGAPMLIYVYYAFDNRPGWFRLLWRATDVLRRAISKAPSALKSVVPSFLLRSCIGRWPARHGFFGCNVANWPLSAYRARTYYVMRTDALDRFGTRLEHRMSRAQIGAMMEQTGLGDIRFSETVPFWCAVGRKI